MAKPTIVVTTADIIGRKVSTIWPAATADAVSVIEISYVSSLVLRLQKWGSRSFALDLFLFRPIPTHHRVDKRSLGKVTARHRRIIEGWRISGPDRTGKISSGVRLIPTAYP